MTSEARDRQDVNLISRRVLIKTAGVAAGAIALSPRIAAAQAPAPMAFCISFFPVAPMLSMPK